MPGWRNGSAQDFYHMSQALVAGNPEVVGSSPTSGAIHFCSPALLSPQGVDVADKRTAAAYKAF